MKYDQRTTRKQARQDNSRLRKRIQQDDSKQQVTKGGHRKERCRQRTGSAIGLAAVEKNQSNEIYLMKSPSTNYTIVPPLPLPTKMLLLPCLLLSSLLLLLPDGGLAQCPWTRDSAELHSDCICDFNPSLTTNLEHQQHQINRMSVQCAPVDFNHLLQALKQTASIELPVSLAHQLDIPTSGHQLDESGDKVQQQPASIPSGNKDPASEEELREAGLQLASQAKLDLLHVSNSTIGRLERNSFILDLATSSLGAGARNQLLATIQDQPNSIGPPRLLVVAIQSLHLSRCKIELIAPGAFNGLEWSLTSLSLSDNQLEFVPTGALQRLINLRVLDLSNNRIRLLTANSFVALTKLNTLRLADNRIGGHQAAAPQLTATTQAARQQQQQEVSSGWFEFSAGSRGGNSSAASANGGSDSGSGNGGASGLDQMAFAGLEMSLTDLNLKNTQLDVFPMAIKRLTRLAFLNLAQNQISNIPGRSFALMSSLTAINLERNRISNIEDDTFHGVEESLSSLSLLGNLLETFPVQQLSKLISLRRLDMGFNGIETLPSNAFQSNKRLILIALDGNPLETLPELAFKPLEGTLRGMSIGGKALNCDCRLSWMLRWQQEFNMQISSRERQPQFCAKPHYLRSLVSFSALKPEHLTCNRPQHLQYPSSSSAAASSSSHQPNYQVSILPRNSTSNAWTANVNQRDNNTGGGGGATYAGTTGSAPETTTTSQIISGGGSSQQQQQVSTVPYFTLPSHFSSGSSSSEPQPLTPTTIGQFIAPSDPPQTPAQLSSINKPPILSTQAATLNVSNSSIATNLKDTSYALPSPPDDSASEQSTIVATTMMSTPSSTTIRNPVVVVTGTNGQFLYSTNAFISSGPDLVEAGTNDDTTRRSDTDDEDEDAADSTDTIEPPAQHQAAATTTTTTADSSHTILESPSSFGERNPQNNSTFSTTDINQQQQQQLSGNSVSSLPDDELFLQTDTNFRKLNRQGYVAQGAQHNRLEASGGELSISDEVLRRQPPTIASARTTTTHQSRRNNTTTTTTTSRTSSDTVGAASEPGKRLRPIFGNRAAGGDGAATMVAPAATTTTQQRWEHRRSSPSPGFKANSTTRFALGGAGSGSQSVVPAVPSTISVYKPTPIGDHLSTPAQTTLNDQAAAPMAGQRLNSTPTHHHQSADQHLSKGARFVDSIEGGEQQQPAASPVARIQKPNQAGQANNNRLRQFNNHHRHQQHAPTGSSQVVNSTRQLIDSNVERQSSASSSSGVQSSRATPTAISTSLSSPPPPPPLSSSSDPLSATQPIQLDRIQADSPPAAPTTTTTRDEPLNTSPPTGNPRILPNNTRMSVSSMYRLSRPSTVPLAPSSSTTTPAPDPNLINRPPQVVPSSNISSSNNAPQHRRHHYNRHLVSSTSTPTPLRTADGFDRSSTNQLGSSQAPSLEANKAETTTRMAATVRIVDSLTVAPSNSTETASESTSKTATTSSTTAKPSKQPDSQNHAVTAASEIVPISVEPLGSESSQPAQKAIAPIESGRNDGDDNRLLQRFDNQSSGQIESNASPGLRQLPSNRGVQSSPPPQQTRVPETFSSIAEDSAPKMVQENVTYRPSQPSTGDHQPTSSGSGIGSSSSSSNRPLLVTRNSFNQQQQQATDLVAFGNGSHGGIGTARIFGRFIRLPDFDQMALILAAILCLFILTMALTVICVCYSSYSASNSGCSSGSLSCKLPAKASRLSSFSSSDESSSAAPNTHNHQTNGLQHQLSSTRINSSKSSQLLRKIFCCWLLGPNRVAGATTVSGSSNNRKAKRLTHMRSLILQDDVISSGSSGASQPLPSGLKVSTAGGSGSMLLATATGSHRKDTLGDQELLFHTLKGPSVRRKEPWIGSQRQHQSNRKANNPDRSQAKVVGRSNGGFDDGTLENRFVGPTRSAGKLQREASLHRREPNSSSYAEQQEYFMGLRRSLSMAHRSESLAAGGSSKQLLQVSSGPDPETLSSGSCDSDKSCSPGANKNNRYNISDAHRAYMASNKGAHQIQASMFVSSTPSSQIANSARQSGLLQAIDDQQQHHHHQVEYFDGRLSSDKSTTDDSRAPLGSVRRLDHDFRLADNQTTATATATRGTKSFGTALKRSLRRSRQDVKQQVAVAAPPNVRAPSGCELEYMSSELVPMSAEEQWPEPYLDPADEQQHNHQVSFDCKESQFVQYRPEATNYMMSLNKQQQQQHQKLHHHHHHQQQQHQQKQQHRSQNLFPMMEQEEVGRAANRRLSQGNHSGTMLKAAAVSGPHDDMYLATNWHTARRPTQRPLHKPMQGHENHVDYSHHQNNTSSGRHHHHNHHNHHHEQRLAHDDTDSHINGTSSNNPNNASLLRYRSIPSLNNVPVDHMGPGKAFLASQIVGATNWLRWTPATNFQASCGDDRVAFGSSQDNASSRHEPPHPSGTWNRDNQVESMYVATGHHKHLR